MHKYLSALVILMLCAANAFADACPVKEYKDRLSKIGFKDVGSVDLAANELIKSAENKKEKCRETLIFEFRKYYYEALGKHYEQSNVGNWEYPISDAKRREIDLSLSKVGWALKESEGMYYIGEAGGWFEKRFSSILTEAYRRYLTIRTKEIKEGFSEDAGLLISWEQIRERIATWEQFIKDHPGFEENPDIRYYLNLYLRTFLTGMDNSRIYDYDTKKLTPDIKKAYERFLSDNKNSAYYKLVKEYYDMLKKNNFIVPEGIDEYFAKRGFETMLGKQPPTY